MNRNRIKRLVTMLRLFVTADGLKKSDIVKKVDYLQCMEKTIIGFHEYCQQNVIW